MASWEMIRTVICVRILLLVRLVQLRWIPSCVRWLDALIARPIGAVLDATLFCAAALGWSLSVGVVLPVAQCAAVALDLVILPLLTYLCVVFTREGTLDPGGATMLRIIVLVPTEASPPTLCRSLDDFNMA